MTSRSSIADGDPIATPLSKSQLFPPMVLSMISVGGQTGGLNGCHGAVDHPVSGVIVGGIFVTMYLPIFDMVSAAG